MAPEDALGGLADPAPNQKEEQADEDEGQVPADWVAAGWAGDVDARRWAEWDAICLGV